MNKNKPNSQKNTDDINEASPKEQKNYEQKIFDWEFDCEDDENYEPNDKDLLDANNWDDLDEINDYEELESDQTEYYFLDDDE